MARPILLPLLALLAGACGPNAAYMNSKDIDAALDQGQIKTVCVAMESEDAGMRTYATKKLQSVQDPAALDCVCEHITRAGQWDPAVATGLEKSTRDDMVGCLVKLVDDPLQSNVVDLVSAIAKTKAPMARARLATLASSAGPTDVRTRALRTLTGAPQVGDLDILLKLVASDSAKEIRAMAADELYGVKDPRAEAALRAAYTSDAEPVVRSMALATLWKVPVADNLDLACKTMMDDPAPEVRATAVSLLRGTKDVKAVGCLRKKAFTEEKSEEVREKLLDVLRSSPTEESASILCDAIPFWIQTYAVDNVPEKIKGANISKVQNDRDYEKSLQCFAKAYAKRAAYSCFGKQHIAWWYREVGAKVNVPSCPGSPAPDGNGQPAKPAAPRRSGEVEGSGVSISG